MERPPSTPVIAQIQTLNRKMKLSIATLFNYYYYYNYYYMLIPLSVRIGVLPISTKLAIPYEPIFTRPIIEVRLGFWSMVQPIV